MTISLGKFLNDQNLLGSDFAAPSWDAWKNVLKGAFAEQMTDAEVARFRELASRDPPHRRVRELWLGVGRRGGKDSVASAIATYLAVYGNFAPSLRRGEVASIVCLACTREQAAIVFGYIRGYFEQIPVLKALVRSATDDTVVLSNNVEIVVATNSFRHIRGKTVAAAIFDEVAFWRDEQYQNPDTAIYNAILPSMITLQRSGGMIVGISTVHRRAGLLHDKIASYLGQNSDDALAILAPSVALNPCLAEPEAQAEIERQMQLDPEAAGSEWLSRWRDDLTDMYDAALVGAAVEKDRRINFPRVGTRYLMAADPSGGRGDAFTCAVGHLENDLIIIDRIHERRAPFDVEVAMDEVAQIAHDYRTTVIYHDDYAADFAVSGFRRRGLTSREIGVRVKGADFRLSRSEIYLNALAPFTAGRVRLPDEPRLIHQLVSLERRPTSSGHDRVDHGRSKNAHDDIANATCAVIALLNDRAKQSLVVSSEVLANSRLPPGVRVPRTLADLPADATSREKTNYMSGAAPAAAPAAPAAHHPLYITAETLQRAAERPAARPTSFDLAAHHH